jgi:uracil phosphoribosyltransferase
MNRFAYATEKELDESSAIRKEMMSMTTEEISKEFETKEVEVKTPVGIAKCKQLAKDVVLVPILRAGLGMVDGVNSLIPTAKIGHLGLYRDEETLEPHEYYVKFPKNITSSHVLILDPMLATGGSVVHAINVLKEYGVKNMSYVGIVGAPEGLNALTKAHPDVNVYLAALDEKLNEKGYIVPGLGDCGDRLFGTK